jgi:hypothetical protein
MPQKRINRRNGGRDTWCRCMALLWALIMASATPADDAPGRNTKSLNDLEFGEPTTMLGGRKWPTRDRSQRWDNTI